LCIPTSGDTYCTLVVASVRGARAKERIPSPTQHVGFPTEWDAVADRDGQDGVKRVDQGEHASGIAKTELTVERRATTP